MEAGKCNIFASYTEISGWQYEPDSFTFNPRDAAWSSRKKERPGNQHIGGGWQIKKVQQAIPTTTLFILLRYVTYILQRYAHDEHPSQKYSLNWEFNQCGSGWLSLGNYFGNSLVFIRRSEPRSQRKHCSTFQSVFHPNVIGLIEAFRDDHAFYLVYNYEGLSVSLSQVISTPNVRLYEIEIAGVCHAVLKGLEYLHDRLSIAHGNITCGNVLLCHDGNIKIANIGESMLETKQATFLEDRIRLRSLISILGQLGSQDIGGLSSYGMHFSEQLETASYACLFEHNFLDQIDAGVSWRLIPHYLDTLMYWGILRV